MGEEHQMAETGSDEAENFPTRAQLLAALDASVKLQSHYANLLNTYDGGHRMSFANGDAWITRLQDIGEL